MEPAVWPYPIVRLKPGKEALLSKGHPWVYSGALAEPPSAPVVRLADAAGRVLGVGTASARNPLAVRLFRAGPSAAGPGLLPRRGWSGPWRGGACWAWTAPEAGCRWVFGEGDLLPGAGGGPLRPGPGGAGGHGRGWRPCAGLVAAAAGAGPGRGHHRVRGAQPGRPQGGGPGSGEPAAQGLPGRPGGDPRGGGAALGGPAQGPEDRLLPGPAGAPAHPGPDLRGLPGAQRLRLHRRLLHPRRPGRGRRRWPPWTSPGRPWTRPSGTGP